MRVLAIETASEACSVALFDAGRTVASEFRVLGRGHAERLVPMIADLPDSGRAERIVVSLGPGSFTGVRIGLAAARALGIAWGAEVLGYPTMALVARQSPLTEPEAVTVCMAAGHGEWFVQNFRADGAAQDAVRSLSPHAAVDLARHSIIVGNRAAELAALSNGERTAIDLLPDARRAMVLPEVVLSRKLAPIYGRGPDARLPQ